MKAVVVAVATLVVLLAVTVSNAQVEILSNQSAKANAAASLSMYQHPASKGTSVKTDIWTGLPKKGKWILIDLKKQMAYAYLNRAQKRQFRTCTGKKNYDTPPGNYRVYMKIPGKHEVKGRPWTGIMYNPVYFYGAYALHGSSEIRRRPSSHGCCRLYYRDARWLFKWALIGTPVIIVKRLR